MSKGSATKLHNFVPTKFIETMATIMEPMESEAPILSRPVREAMFSWMTEIKSVEVLKAVGLEPRKTMILHGIPGCGKTTLAHHVAARLGLPLVLVNMQTIMSASLGGTGNNIDNLFADLQGQENNCVLFLDEFDSIAAKRMAAQQACDTEMNNVVVAILQKMDAFTGTLIAATNRGKDIDPAIWRRFAMHVAIDLPDRDCSFAILKRYLTPFHIDDDALECLAHECRGATPALMRQLSESIKRDIILGPRLKYLTDASSTILRAVAMAQPHEDLSEPPFWKDQTSVIQAFEQHWPLKESNS